MLLRNLLAKFAPLAAIILTASAVRGDTFGITVTNLDGTSIGPGESVTVRAFKLNTSVVSPDLNQVTMNRGNEIRIAPVPSRKANGDLTLSFQINRDDASLTNNQTSPDTTIVLIFNRDNLDTAAVPFFVVANAQHSLAVAVPTAIQYKSMQPSVECPCPILESRRPVLFHRFRHH